MALVSIFPEISDRVAYGTCREIIGISCDANHIPCFPYHEGAPEEGLSDEGYIFSEEKESRTDKPVCFLGVLCAFLGVLYDHSRMHNDGESGFLGAIGKIGIFVVEEESLIEESDDAEHRGFDERRASGEKAGFEWQIATARRSMEST